MSTDEIISDPLLIQKSGAWHSIDKPVHPYSIINTGFHELDKVIKLGGWPLGTTTEIGLADDGIGELRLLMPALRNIQSKLKPYIIWLAPPYLPYSQALLKQHIDLSHLIIVNSKGAKNTLWAAEQVLMANSCCALFTWTGSYNLSHKETRRLQLAAARSSTWHVQFRHHDCMQQTSAARMRLRIEMNIRGLLSVVIDKQPQGINGQKCTLSLAPHYEKWHKLSVEALPQNNRPLSTHSLTLRQGLSVDLTASNKISVMKKS